ncbi:hypothetical protein F4820DRAFT_405900 [Hypoxylon rubiginosum]|uniref:Uncharacterized protein n=1 Tax=Hypoxylon rubiginosum TaxID=110542 RepID=A0ACB9ZEW7_9PEZI|nr:hypothetical protein F4820DRAFT_405900 [Hypoxylon rubiginosum]
MPETLREKATKKLQGPDANPSQLGDPISLKAEQSDNIPTEEEKGAHGSSQPHSNNKNKTSKKDENGKRNGGHESLREKAMKKLHGPDANTSQLGDPISLKAETSDTIPTESEEGAHNGRDSKL